MAEHGLDGSAPVIGFAFDGTGYGTGRRRPGIWGGEVLVADYDGFARAGHLADLPLPGGDAQSARPYRMALAHLAAAGIDLDEDLSAGGRPAPTAERHGLRPQVATGLRLRADVRAWAASSMRSPHCSVSATVSYEAQAAIELEAAARAARRRPSPLRFGLDDDGVIDPAPVLAGSSPAARGRRAGASVPASTRRLRSRGRDSAACAAATRPGRSASAGGVFQNALLLELGLCGSLDEPDSRSCSAVSAPGQRRRPGPRPGPDRRDGYRRRWSDVPRHPRQGRLAERPTARAWPTSTSAASPSTCAWSTCPTSVVGDYVIVHVGFAITAARRDVGAADAALRELGILERSSATVELPSGRSRRRPRR